MYIKMDLSPDAAQIKTVRHLSFQQKEMRCSTCGNTSVGNCSLCASVAGANLQITPDGFSFGDTARFFIGCILAAVLLFGLAVGVLR